MLQLNEVSTFWLIKFYWSVQANVSVKRGEYLCIDKEVLLISASRKERLSMVEPRFFLESCKLNIKGLNSKKQTVLVAVYYFQQENLEKKHKTAEHIWNFLQD